MKLTIDVVEKTESDLAVEVLNKAIEALGPIIHYKALHKARPVLDALPEKIRLVTSGGLRVMFTVKPEGKGPTLKDYEWRDWHGAFPRDADALRSWLIKRRDDTANYTGPCAYTYRLSDWLREQFEKKEFKREQLERVKKEAAMTLRQLADDVEKLEGGENWIELLKV